MESVTKNGETMNLRRMVLVDRHVRTRGHDNFFFFRTISLLILEDNMASLGVTVESVHRRAQWDTSYS